MSEGKKIREYRERKNLSVTELAKRIGVSRSYLSRMETGERPIKTDILNKIANAIGIPIQEFYSDQDMRSFDNKGEEIIVIDKKRHNLDNFTNEEILEFIRIGKENSKKNVD